MCKSLYKQLTRHFQSIIAAQTHRKKVEIFNYFTTRAFEELQFCLTEAQCLYLSIITSWSRLAILMKVEDITTNEKCSTRYLSLRLSLNSRLMTNFVALILHLNTCNCLSYPLEQICSSGVASLRYNRSERALW